MRTVSVAGATHLALPATTTCRLWKVIPVSGSPFGLTSLDRDVVFNDGAGTLTYKAKRGYTPYAIESTADLAVDNSEMEVLIAEFEVDGFTSDAIRRGVYDGAAYVEYIVNYMDLPAGIISIPGSGYVGRIGQVDDMVCFPEVRSLTQQTKQKSIIELGSNNCRVVQFGDERCGVDVDALLVSATVTAVGLETDRAFTIDGATLDDNALYPGIVKFLTGANAGRTYEVEGNVGNVITLAIPTEAPIAEDDTLEHRPDCTRLWGAPLTEDANSCNAYSNRPFFRGEPFRPVAETESLMAPGAASSGSHTPGGTDETATP